MNRTNGRNVPDPALSPSRALFRRLAAQDGEFEPPELFQQLFRRFRGEAADPFFERFFTGFRFSADEADRDRAVTPELFSLLAEAAAGRRADGSFYTPPGIAAAMAEEGLALRLTERLPEELLSLWETLRRGEMPDAPPLLRRRLAAELEQEKILDPACGAGAFLLAAADRLAQWRARLLPEEGTEERLAFLRRISCRLYGVDPDRTALAAARFRAALRFGMEPDEALPRLRCGDALAADAFSGAERFGLVLGNPPYLSFGVRGSGVLDRALQRDWRERFPGSAEYKISVYALFMELAVRLAEEPGGVAALLLPDSFLAGSYYSRIRAFLLDRCRIVSLRLLRERLFDAAVGFNVALVLVREPDAGRRAVNRVRIAESSGRSRLVAQRELAPGARRRFELCFSEAEEELLRRCREGSRPLGELIRFSSGLIARNGRASLLAAEDVRSPYCRRGLLSGRAVERFRIRRDGESFGWILVDPALIKSGLGRIDYQKPKLLLRQTGDELIAAADREGLFCFNNLHVGIPAPGVPLEFLEGVLNSRLLTRLYRILAGEWKRTLPQVDIDLLRTLPVRRSPALEARIAAAAREMEQLPSPAGQVVVDRLVEQLYGVTPELLS